MNREETLFITLLSDYINEKKTSVCGFFDFDILYKIAARHQLVPIIYYQIKRMEGDIDKFKKDYFFQIYQYAQRNILNSELESCISEYDYAFMKGKVVGSLYPTPELRTMVDTDVLIHEKDRQDIQTKLSQQGFVEKENYNGVWVCSKNGLTFEIHESLIEDKLEKKKYVKYFDKVWDYYSDHEIKWEYHLVYIIMHLRDHFIGRGVGIRQFMDVAVITKKLNLDWKWIETELDKINLLGFAKKVFYLNECWFDIASPFSTTDINEEFVGEATDLILSYGTFGNVREDTPGYWIVKYATEKNISFNAAKRKLRIALIFPSYKVMQSLPRYAYLRRNKILLPVAWIHRFIIETSNGKRRETFIHRTFQHEDTSLKRLQIMEDWELKRK